MGSFKIFAMVCLIVAKARSTPVPQPQNDLLTGILPGTQLGVQTKESDIFKRRVFDDNPDKELKQIAFSSLIGDLENSLFASAVSVNNVVNDKYVELPQIKPGQNDDADHKSISKRHLSAQSSITAATTESASVDKEQNVILQTTEKVPEANGVPAHIIIDRIAIQPHTGGVPLIPTFEIKRAGNENTSEITKISITKTEISAVPNIKAPTSTSAATPTAASVESTTKKNKDHLKEVEEELKEKVAEIEANPVILSARV